MRDIQRGLDRANKADQARVQSTQRMAAKAIDPKCTAAIDVRLYAATSKHSPQEYADAYARQQQQEQQ